MDYLLLTVGCLLIAVITTSTASSEFTVTDRQRIFIGNRPTLSKRPWRPRIGVRKREISRRRQQQVLRGQRQHYDNQSIWARFIYSDSFNN